jgi:hypothetical protein
MSSDLLGENLAIKIAHVKTATAIWPRSQAGRAWCVGLGEQTQGAWETGAGLGGQGGVDVHAGPPPLEEDVPRRRGVPAATLRPKLHPATLHEAGCCPGRAVSPQFPLDAGQQSFGVAVVVVLLQQLLASRNIRLLGPLRCSLFVPVINFL